ncbi:uncharacterized, partial [Tachysurus ichikawai]
VPQCSVKEPQADQHKLSDELSTPPHDLQPSRCRRHWMTDSYRVHEERTRGLTDDAFEL